MAKRILVLVGTKKGAFILESDADRRSWEVRGPFCETWPLNHVKADPATGTIYAAGGSEWFGPAIWKSTDLGRTWSHSSEGLTYGEGKDPIKTAWSIGTGSGPIYAGVQPAGLFRSDDAGLTWSHVGGLQEHPSRKEWQPGGAGLILHGILTDPTDADALWVAISAAGVFHTADGGTTWEPRNHGTRCDYNPEDQRYPEFGQCVHCLVMAPGRPDRLFQQNHCGMYRSEDGGRRWDSIESGLPTSFGFAAATHPTDPDTLFLVPLNGDSIGRYVPDGRAAVWRTRDAGASWEPLREGLPQANTYFAVLRQAMATDMLEPAGVYLGTNTGTVFASADEGDRFAPIAEHLPMICSIETLTIDA
ncbi:MAG: exo-alpha-sialidase [Geminicoccaceae bacterium]